MKLAQFVPLDAGGPLTKQSLTQGKTDLGLVFSSDGGLGEQGLVVLEVSAGHHMACHMSVDAN